MGISSYEFIKNRIIYLADKGHLRPFKKEKGHWRISNLKDILPIKESENIKFKLSSDFKFSANKKTLYIFPTSMSSSVYEKLNGNDDIVTFPSFVLPFCKLPQGFEWNQWKRYGGEVQKLLMIDRPLIEERLELFFKTRFSDYDRIVVTHTDSVSERLFLYLVSSLINSDLYELNLTKCSKDETIDSSDGVAPNYFDYLFLPDAANLISPKDRNKMSEYWEHIISEPSDFRIFDSNKEIAIVSIDFLDESMVEYCTTKYENLNKQVCHFALSKPFGLNFCSLDRFTLVRLIELAKNGKLFPYYAKTKEELSVDAFESIVKINYNKVILLNKKLPKTLSLFD